MSEYLTEEDVEKAHWEYIDEMGEDSYDHVPFRVPTKAAMTAALEAVLPEIIRRAKADAWDEGHQIGQENIFDHSVGLPGFPNPYKEVEP